MASYISVAFDRKHSSLTDVSTPHATADIADSAITTAKIADSAVTPGKLSFGSWEKIAHITVETNTQQVDITGLDGDNDICYLLIILNKNAHTTGNTSLILRFNDDDGNNYDMCRITSDGSSVATWSATDQNGLKYVFQAPINNVQLGYFTLWAKSGSYRCLVDLAQWNATSKLYVYQGYWKNTSDNLTKMSFINNTGDYIGAGSTFILFRLSK